ncbi:hypothetical protein AJ79_03393 [Helicocarpus griseus UAMH5409]|uniref:Dynamin-type G domain-containing protein n=1 Tax=Helicocarpus griseus UAMH5409 TaxID=1447875 RepID=A0A2B7XY02_9EURO|nr:hypothetical protein AJ79_03393 [Helicocarpus griseus UAMH5409]
MDSSPDAKSNGAQQAILPAESSNGTTSTNYKPPHGELIWPGEPNKATPDHKSAMAAPQLTTISLESLQSAEQRELLDLVDRLRRAGLSSVLQLPQIVVCGDQSSGKSSVLEAITEIPFPRKENLCTRFATEIIMKRDGESCIICKINPDSTRPDEEQAQLRDFSRKITDFAELPSVIDDATTAMGLNDRKAFGKDVLSVELCGPNRPQLTLVDLPGLIHSANRSQSEEDVELIKSLVQEYICQSRTIILAVVSAKNDYANQVILDYCRKFDPKGSRTLGVITKPDFLRPGSENESVWLDLAQNRDIYFELGWHLLKNRGDGEHHMSFMERNLKEHVFFDSGSYKAIPKHAKGIESLRERLSQLLFCHLKRELPTLKEELDRMATTTRAQLDSLGRSRQTLAEQRAYLADFFSSGHDVVIMALNGNYDDSFFGDLSTLASIDKSEVFRPLRAVIQELNIQFADCIHRRGHQFSIQENDTNESSDPIALTSDPKSLGQTTPAKLTREEAVQRVVKTLERNRGRELPGIFNPMLISLLFWEQSKGWEVIARDHVTKIAAACKNFLFQVLDDFASPDIKSQLLNLAVLPALEKAKQAALNELKNIEEDRRRQPITYNHYFTDTWQEKQQQHSRDNIRKLAEESTEQVFVETRRGPTIEKNYINPATFNAKFDQSVERDMDKFSAKQALDAHDAYYKSEKKYFVDVVAKQVIERRLVAPLAEVFSPRVLARYSDKEISFLASEPPETVRMREHLESRCKMFEEGQDAFCVAMGQSVP